MSALLSMLAAKVTPYIIGAVAILAAFVGAYLKGRSAGKRTAETAQKAKEADSYAKSLKDVEDAAYAGRSVRLDDGGMLNDPNNRDRKG